MGQDCDLTSPPGGSGAHLSFRIPGLYQLIDETVPWTQCWHLDLKKESRNLTIFWEEKSLHVFDFFPAVLSLIKAGSWQERGFLHRGRLNSHPQRPRLRVRGRRVGEGVQGEVRVEQVCAGSTQWGHDAPVGGQPGTLTSRRHMTEDWECGGHSKGSPLWIRKPQGWGSLRTELLDLPANTGAQGLKH